MRLSEPPFFWVASPLYVLFRIGMVGCLLGVLQTRGGGLSAPAIRPEGSYSALLARHSLVAYVVHLLLLYGTPLAPNIASRFARRLDLVEATAALACVLLLTILATRAWATLSREQVLGRGWVQAALTLLGVLVLLR